MANLSENGRAILSVLAKVKPADCAPRSYDRLSLWS
jgi:hypothetical protein